MSAPTLATLRVANASFVTPSLLVGGDLDTDDPEHALDQLTELVEAGVTHVLDARIEWSDYRFMAAHAPGVAYLHHGMDDAGQVVPDEWFDEAAGWAVDAIDHGGVVLAHCHMGINRGPSLGFAVLLALGWRPDDAITAIRAARPIAYAAYAEDALSWHHRRSARTQGRGETTSRTWPPGGRATRWTPDT